MEEFDRFIKQYDFVDYQGMVIVLRELLINAIVHGNKERLESIVTCRIDGIEGKMFKIEVEDEGSGFDYKSINMDIPEDPRALKRRGYILINALSDQIIFKGKGNQIIVYMDMSNEDGEK
jgi:serine/threonine-protein kinase RsbW